MLKSDTCAVDEVDTVTNPSMIKEGPPESGSVGARRDPDMLRRIEDLRDQDCVHPALVVECPVDDTISLLVFDVPVTREVVSLLL